MPVKVKREIHNNSYYEPNHARRWAIFVDGKLVEGGFTTRVAAEQQALEYSKPVTPTTRP